MTEFNEDKAHTNLPDQIDVPNPYVEQSGWPYEDIRAEFQALGSAVAPELIFILQATYSSLLLKNLYLEDMRANDWQGESGRHITQGIQAGFTRFLKDSAGDSNNSQIENFAHLTQLAATACMALNEAGRGISKEGITTIYDKELIVAFVTAYELPTSQQSLTAELINEPSNLLGYLYQHGQQLELDTTDFELLESDEIQSEFSSAFRVVLLERLSKFWDTQKIIDQYTRLAVSKFTIHHQRLLRKNDSKAVLAFKDEKASNLVEKLCMAARQYIAERFPQLPDSQAEMPKSEVTFLRLNAVEEVAEVTGFEIALKLKRILVNAHTRLAFHHAVDLESIRITDIIPLLRTGIEDSLKRYPEISPESQARVTTAILDFTAELLVQEHGFAWKNPVIPDLKSTVAAFLTQQSGSIFTQADTLIGELQKESIIQEPTFKSALQLVVGREEPDEVDQLKLKQVIQDAFHQIPQEILDLAAVYSLRRMDASPGVRIVDFTKYCEKKIRIALESMQVPEIQAHSDLLITFLFTLYAFYLQNRYTFVSRNNVFPTE